MNSDLKQKLELLPKSPGVYYHKDIDDKIIYVGKAANLRSRVKQYFQKSRIRDSKTDLLVSEIHDTDWTQVADEIEALFLEAEMIRRYQPRYNILLRDDKSVAYVRINIKDKYPSVTITRSPLDDNANYYGPFLQVAPLRKSLNYLRKIFPYSTHINIPARACLQYHIGLCPGPETESYDELAYKDNIKKLVMYISGSRVALIKQLEKEMVFHSKNQQFELAAKSRNSLTALKQLRARIIFSDKENLDLSKDHALNDIYELFNLKKPPRRIEGFDISHMGGTDTVASMVVFTNGIADKGAYRKFKMNIAGNDDFAHMNEVIKRRLSNKNIKAWGLPDLIIIDGGKGQLSAATSARKELDVEGIPMIGLAKKHEEIVISKNSSDVVVNENIFQKMNGYKTDESIDFERLVLPESSHLIKLLTRVRDESHRFAVSYHSYLKSNRQTSSVLDSIPGIGNSTKRKLLKNLGSLKAVSESSIDDLKKAVGPSKAAMIKKYISKDTHDSK
jgi:excinuclease ABC subunit C